MPSDILLEDGMSGIVGFQDTDRNINQGLQTCPLLRGNVHDKWESGWVDACGT
jgi:hypothetical protein